MMRRALDKAGIRPDGARLYRPKDSVLSLLEGL